MKNLEDFDSLNELDKKQFFFKLYPLELFENEELKEIFSYQFTGNFSTINLTQLYNLNDRLWIKEYLHHKNLCFYKFPELNIIIEQGINSLFYIENSKLSYKIEPCNYGFCLKRNILLIYCECLKNIIAL